MTAFVVDTNVAIVANGCAAQVDQLCQLTCVRKLKSLVAEGVVAIDDGMLILNEYIRCLNLSGKPGVGDAFFKHVFDNQCQSDRVRRVRVTPSADDRRGFEELPENSFDPEDRKFLAVAVAANAVVLNAADRHWSQHTALMSRLGVDVRQLCPQHVSERTGRTRP